MQRKLNLRYSLCSGSTKSIAIVHWKLGCSESVQLKDLQCRTVQKLMKLQYAYFWNLKVCWPSAKCLMRHFSHSTIILLTFFCLHSLDKEVFTRSECLKHFWTTSIHFRQGGCREESLTICDKQGSRLFWQNKSNQLLRAVAQAQKYIDRQTSLYTLLETKINNKQII